MDLNKESFAKRYGLIIGVIVLLGICVMPTPAGLSVAGQRMLGILLFSIIVWIAYLAILLMAVTYWKWLGYV